MQREQAGRRSVLAALPRHAGAIDFYVFQMPGTKRFFL